MAARRRTLRILTGAAAVSLALASTAWSRPVPPQPGAQAPAADGPATLCAPAGVLRDAQGARADVSLCAGSGTPVMALSAPATCRRPGTSVRYACLTSGSWTAKREGATVASGTLPGSQPFPGPGTYDVTATVRVRSAPAGVDLRGTVRATLTLTAPKQRPTHRVEVDRQRLRPGTTTTLTYTVYRDSEQGDGSARFGLIGEETTGVRISTADARCVNPLIGRAPSEDRLTHSVDCALTDLQPGRPATVRVRVTLASACSTVVSKLGYWMPRGQALHTGGMVEGPTVGCD
ncbi:hypothetical protein [Streptomyces lomondensis]|uniref:Uncharacterized protein n=1 Tax=Streptomyces lomondensis TaxID=68229 RepID=A0ABQ2XK49_9ACTN|nr:hypothetical protein [Streptomyces lomondensis]MCF0079757.1 hypothetical protein [Streptomyces lomondensis]GGX20219.1 hypothetical protein GCM10010383_58130 [Streptomyces lomondensis]